MAREARTIPGRQATFATCRSAWSSRIPCISRSSANTRPGTRIFPCTGMRKRQSSTVSIRSDTGCVTRTLLLSDVEYDPHPPGAAAADEPDLVVRDRLDLTRERVARAVDGLAARHAPGPQQRPVHALDRERSEQQTLRLQPEQELAQPADQEILEALAPHHDAYRAPRTDRAAIADQVEHRARRILEQARQRDAAHHGPDVGRVLEEFVAARRGHRCLGRRRPARGGTAFVSSIRENSTRS